MATQAIHSIPQALRFHLPSPAKRLAAQEAVPSAQPKTVVDELGNLKGTEPPRQPFRPNVRKVAIIGAAVVGLIGATAGGFAWLQFATSHEETDDAYTTAHIHGISARLNDTVLKVLVDDNQHVKAGQPLVVLDPNDYQVRVDQALAALDMARQQANVAQTSIRLAATNASGKGTEAQGNVASASAAISKAMAAVAEAKSTVPQRQAELAQRQAEEHRAALDYQRFQKLAEQGAVSIQQRDQALRDYQVAMEGTKAAQEAVSQAISRVSQATDAVLAAKASLQQSEGVVEQAKALNVQTQISAGQFQVAASSVKQAEAQLRDAQLQLSYTNIVSPVDGTVGKKAVEEGQRVQPGQQLMSLVGDDIWVVANFKETQLERMRPSQNVEVKIDRFPHHTFRGHVDSFSPGSGASFALLPPENATGNFTKIVQRIPVKVVLDPASTKGFERLLVPGMSAVVSVDVSH